MTFKATWRMFRRMQDSTVAAAALIYAAAVVYAWRVLPDLGHMKTQRTLLFPGVAFLLAVVAILTVGPIRRALSRHVWISYRTGFGQSVISVLSGVAVLIVVAGFIYWNTWAATRGGPYPAGVFSGYAAGIGLLLAQAIIVRLMERDPVLRAQIEEGAP
jgi:hypothetical protein